MALVENAQAACGVRSQPEIPRNSEHFSICYRRCVIPPAANVHVSAKLRVRQYDEARRVGAGKTNCWWEEIGGKVVKLSRSVDGAAIVRQREMRASGRRRFLGRSILD